MNKIYDYFSITVYVLVINLTVLPSTVSGPSNKFLVRALPLCTTHPSLPLSFVPLRSIPASGAATVPHRPMETETENERSQERSTDGVSNTYPMLTLSMLVRHPDLLVQIRALAHQKRLNGYEDYYLTVM